MLNTYKNLYAKYNGVQVLRLGPYWFRTKANTETWIRWSGFVEADPWQIPESEYVEVTEELIMTVRPKLPNVVPLVNPRSN